MSNQHFANYISPNNIVIVPTVSFCEPPTKKQKPNNDVPQAAAKTTSALLIAPLKNKKPCATVHPMKNTSDVSMHVINNVPIQDNSFQMCNSEDFSTNSLEDTQQRVKKTLSWASNYLQKIGQSQPKLPKPPNAAHQKSFYSSRQQTVNQINVNPGCKNLIMAHSSSKILEYNIHTSTAKNETVINTNLGANRANNNIDCLVNTKYPIKVNLLSHQEHTTSHNVVQSQTMTNSNSPKFDKSNIEKRGKMESNITVNNSNNQKMKKSTNTTLTNSQDNLCTFHNVDKHDKEPNTVNQDCSNSKTNKTILDINYANKNKVLTETKPLKKCIDIRKSNSKVEHKKTHELQASKRKQDHSKIKLHSKEEIVAHTSSKIKMIPGKVEYVHSTKLRSKLSKKNDEKNEKCKVKFMECKTKKNIKDSYKSKSSTKCNKDYKYKTKPSKSCDNSNSKPSHSTPIKSVVQVTNKYDFDGNDNDNFKDLRTKLDVQNSCVLDLRSKLKRKIQNPQPQKRDNLIITVSNDSNQQKEQDKKTGLEKPKLENKKKKYKKIKLIINVVCESSESESDNNEEVPSGNEDLSFLDDFNVDDIVESLNGQEDYANNKRNPTMEQSKNTPTKKSLQNNDTKTDHSTDKIQGANPRDRSKTESSQLTQRFKLFKQKLEKESLNNNNKSKEDKDLSFQSSKTTAIPAIQALNNVSCQGQNVVDTQHCGHPSITFQDEPKKPIISGDQLDYDFQTNNGNNILKLETEPCITDSRLSLVNVSNTTKCSTTEDTFEKTLNKQGDKDAIENANFNSKITDRYLSQVNVSFSTTEDTFEKALDKQGDNNVIDDANSNSQTINLSNVIVHPASNKQIERKDVIIINLTQMKNCEADETKSQKDKVNPKLIQADSKQLKTKHTNIATVSEFIDLTSSPEHIIETHKDLPTTAACAIDKFSTKQDLEVLSSAFKIDQSMKAQMEIQSELLHNEEIMLPRTENTPEFIKPAVETPDIKNKTTNTMRDSLEPIIIQAQLTKITTEIETSSAVTNDDNIKAEDQNKSNLVDILSHIPITKGKATTNDVTTGQLSETPRASANNIHFNPINPAIIATTNDVPTEQTSGIPRQSAHDINSDLINTGIDVKANDFATTKQTSGTPKTSANDSHSDSVHPAMNATEATKIECNLIPVPELNYAINEVSTINMDIKSVKNDVSKIQSTAVTELCNENNITAMHKNTNVFPTKIELKEQNNILDNAWQQIIDKPSEQRETDDQVNEVSDDVLSITGSLDENLANDNKEPTESDKTPISYPTCSVKTIETPKAAATGINAKSVGKLLDTEKENQAVIQNFKNKSDTTSNKIKKPYDILALENRMKQYLKSDYSIESLIKNGKFSKIYLCKDENGCNYALKVLHKGRSLPGCRVEDMLQNLQVDIPRKNYHCIYLVNGFGLKSHWCLLMDYYPKNLQEVLRENNKSFHIDVVQHLARQLISAVLILRNNNIMHLDIKPAHILMNSAHDRLKLAGFDESQYLEGLSVLPCVGTVNYRPPEVIMGYPYFGKIDVWSTALVIYEMSTNRQLFPGIYNNDILYKQLCTLGNMPYEMLVQSVFTNCHYRGAYFARKYGPAGQVLFIDHFKRSQRLPTTLFEAYHREWGSSRTKRQKVEDCAKLRVLRSLLEEMLMLNPVRRIPIEFVSTNTFIYERFDSCVFNFY